MGASILLGKLVNFSLRNWYFIVIGLLCVLLVLVYGRWQDAREEVGFLKAEVNAKSAYAKGLEKKIAEANKAIEAQAQAGTKSYNQCQELARSNVGQAFDRGVQFGRSTCPKQTVPLTSAR